MRDFQNPGRSTVYAERGLCATSHPLAAAVAIDILKQGGNAVDAAIAGAVLLGLCEPQMAGLGGDCFALVHSPDDDTIHALNGSGRAPAGLNPEALRAAGHSKIPVDGVHSVTIPGAIAGFAALSERFGRLGLEASIAPSIDYAEAGIPVAPRVARDWAQDAERLAGDARRFYLKNGRPFSLGEIFRAPGQAAPLRAIAASGPSAFYEGEVADDMIAALRQLGGSHTEADFAACRADWTIPLTGRYRDVEVVEHPPNAQGAVALLMLRMLEGLDVAALDPFGAERVHLEAEIARLAYAARDAMLADPDHMADPESLNEAGLAKRLTGDISPWTSTGLSSPAEAVHKDTVLITVVDRDRMSVSLIYSIFHGFGSGPPVP